MQAEKLHKLPILVRSAKKNLGTKIIFLLFIIKFAQIFVAAQLSSIGTICICGP
jgi:hypothetical protein